MTISPPSRDLSDHFQLLVIDDDVIQRTIISKLGVQAGFLVVAAASYDEAVRRLKAERFDCITLDLSLGTQSGALLLQTIVDHGHRVPVVIISGADDHVLTATTEMAHGLGLDAQPLGKPLNLANLRSVLAGKRNNAVAQRGLTAMQNAHALSG